MSTVSFELRLAEPSDEPFLLELYGATYGQQFALVPLAPAQREMLVRMQFNAQRSGYRQQFPASQDYLILTGGERAGRLWLDESPDEARVIDISIAPAQQGRGLGRAVLEHVIANAATAGKRVRLSVARMNARAFELYLRLGFEVSGEDEVYVEMTRER